MIRRMIMPLKFAFRTSRQLYRPLIQSCRTWRYFCTEKGQDDKLKNLKEESKKFYDQHVDNIIDLQNLEDWQNIVG